MRCSNLETVSCALCGSEEREALYDITLPVSRCRRCGLVYTSTRPRSEVMASYYPDDYVPHAATAPKRSPLARPLRRYLSGLAAYDLPPGRLLDVGCGAGNLMREMRDRGWTVAGVELVESAALRAERYGEVAHGDWRAAIERWPAGSFDAITMIHSLEHMHQPLETLRGLRPLLRDGGRLIVEVPNVDSPVPSLFGEPWFSLPHHLYHFSPGTLETLLEKAGYRVTRRRPVFWATSVASLLSARLGLPNSRWLYVGIASPLAALLCLTDRSDVMSLAAARA